MKNNEIFQTVTLTVDTVKLENGVHALAEFLSACTEDGISAEGLLNHKDQSREQIAEEWIQYNYDPLMSGLRLAAAFAELLSAGFCNDEIQFAPAPHSPQRRTETA